MAPDQKECLRVYIRWMIRRDMPEVLGIEYDSFEFPWSEETFIQYLRKQPVIGMVAECDERVVGFMIYELSKGKIQLVTFAVAAQYRRQGVGSQMVAKLIGKLSPNRRKRITLNIRETNLRGQLFFRANGFRAVSVLRGHYDETLEDAFVMVYRVRPTNEEET